MYRPLCTGLYVQICMYRLVGADLYVQTRMYRLVGTDMYILVHMGSCIQIRMYRPVGTSFYVQTRVHLLAHSGKSATEHVNFHRYSHENGTNSVPKQCLYIIDCKSVQMPPKGSPAQVGRNWQILT